MSLARACATPFLTILAIVAVLSVLAFLALGDFVAGRE